jgi:membrane fusion protein (multidrug efflux system)
VITGIRQNGVVELKDGVQAGERIVADGLNKVQPGQPVRVVGARGPGGAGSHAPGARRPAAGGAQRPAA